MNNVIDYKMIQRTLENKLNDCGMHPIGCVACEKFELYNNENTDVDILLRLSMGDVWRLMTVLDGAKDEVSDVSKKKGRTK